MSEHSHPGIRDRLIMPVIRPGEPINDGPRVRKLVYCRNLRLQILPSDPMTSDMAVGWGLHPLTVGGDDGAKTD